MNGPNAHPHRRTLERVRDHLLRQGERATGRDQEGNVICRNRVVTADGRVLMCAVGCLIPEERYTALSEGVIIEELTPYLDPELGLDPMTDGMDRDMLIALRFVHDRRHPKEWAALLSRMEGLLSPTGAWTADRWKWLEILERDPGEKVTS